MTFEPKHNPYPEYRTNLYVTAMGCVDNGDNVFDNRIPLENVRERFSEDLVGYWPDAYVNPATDETVIVNDTVKIVRVRDGHVHGSRGGEVPQRQYSFLADLASGVTGESPGDLRITAAGTTRNGGRAYLQIATDSVLNVAGMEYDPFINFGMSHDGSLAMTSVAGINIFQCANMVTSAFGRNTARKAKTRQTKRVTDSMVIEKHKILLELESKADEFEAEVQALSETVVTDKQWAAFLDNLAPLDIESANQQTRNESLRGELNSMYTTDERAAEWHGTALGVLQAVNTVDLWNRNVRKGNTATVRGFDESLDGSRAKREYAVSEALNKVLASV